MSTMSSLFEETRNGIAKLFKTGVLSLKLLIVGSFGVFLLVAGGVFDTPGNPLKSGNGEAPKTAAPVSYSYEDALEAKLVGLLSQVRGAGQVSVSITLENTGGVEHARNIVRETKTIQEKDHSGGIRTTTEAKESEQVLMSKENGADKPVMVREYKPVIKGVLVVADGAYDSQVKANLTKAVETGLGLPSYKITVLPHRR